MYNRIIPYLNHCDLVFYQFNYVETKDEDTALLLNYVPDTEFI